MVVKGEVKKFFENRFKENLLRRSKLGDVHFQSISSEDSDMLVADFEDEEVKGAIWGCESSKTPNLDGFNFCFMKEF